MAMLVQCPNPACKASCSVAEANSGGPVRCPKCDKPFVVKPTVDAQKGDTNKHPPASNANPFPVLPAEFGRYRILKLLGRGGMGAVYLAQDSQLGRQVALKVPFFEASKSPQRAERFVREARSAAVLQHPNICTVFDAGQIDGRPFITMAYIAGTPLEDEIDPESPMPQLRAAEIVRKIALALEHAHRKGIVHRDLKPANVMMAAGGEPVVMDFGLAKRVADADPNEAKLTQFGAILGTLSYMAPEQCKGDVAAIGPATDVYALGAMLFEMLTGKTPYIGAMSVVIGQILTAPTPPVREFRPDVDPRLDAICRKAMAKSPAERFPSMAALAHVLGFYLKASSPHLPLPSPPIAAVYTAPASPPAPLPAPPGQRQLKTESGRVSRYDAFFSYSTKDVDVAMALVAALEDKGIRCWVAPRDIMPGKEWGESIIEGIERSGAFVLIFSTHANVSKQVFREVERTIAKGIPVIPFRIEDVPPSKELEYFISAEHWLEAYAPPVLRHAIHLEDAILRLTGGLSRAPDGGERRPKLAEAGSEARDAKQTMASRAGTSNAPIAGKLAPLPAPTSNKAKWVQVMAAAYRRPKWPILAGAAACVLLAGLAVLWAAGVFKVKTADGTIVVENLPADAEVFVDGEKVAIKLTGDDKPIAIQVAPGKRKLEIKTAGFKMETQEVTLAAGERKPIDIRLEPLAAAPEKLAAAPDEITNSIGMKLKLIKPGKFLMGSPKEEEGRSENEGPQHEVEITKAFYMGAYPVTKGQFAAFVKDDGYLTDAEKDGKGGYAWNQATADWEQKLTYFWRYPGFNQGDDHPVVEVSWKDATAFCAWLSKKEGKTYELPTEAEWEYACRAGTTTRFWCGDPDASLQGKANVADASLNEKIPGEILKIAWNDGYAFTSPVGSFKANPWGLYDMHGNVWQWCADGYGPYQERSIKDPNGKENANGRVLRGGSWIDVPRDCRSAVRSVYDPAFRRGSCGFRVVLRLHARTP